MSDLLAPISKFTTRAQSTYTNGSVRGISLVWRVQKQRQSAVKLGSRPNFRTDHVGFQNAQTQSGNQPSKNTNLPYISIGYGGESVSQLPLKDKAVSTFLGQNPPFELRPKTGVSPPSFHGIHRGSSNYWPNPSISVGGGQQGWLAFALRRQRSHVRIVSGAPAKSGTSRFLDKSNI